MARANLTPVELDDAGVAIPAGTTGTADGYSFTNHGKEIVGIKNGGAAPHTVTVQTPATRDDLDIDEREVTIAAGATKLIGPLTPSIYNQVGDDSGKVFVDLDATPAELTGFVLKIPN